MKTIQKDLRSIILTNIGFPIVLLTFGIYHGLLQVLYRAGIIRSTKVLGIEYYQGLTAHGVINAIVLTTFFAVGFGHAVISQTLGGVSAMGAFTSLVLMMLGTLMVAATIFAGSASVLFTFYPPMKAHPEFYIGLVFFVVGSWVAFFSWIGPYLRWRRENPDKKTPMAALGIFATFIVWQIATLPVAYEVIVMLIPWSFGWVDGINIVLARTLFWFFGHPLVYFWLLPSYVMYYTMMPKLAGGKLFSDFAGRFAFLMFVVFSSPLGLHHQFTEPGLSAVFKGLHAVLTSIVAIPSLVTAFTLAASLEYAARKNGAKGLFGWWWSLPHFDKERWLFPYLFMGLVIFVFGGVTGLVNASYNMNLVIHNTAWIPAHFHLTVGGPVFLGILGMSLYLLVGLLGKKMASPKAAIAVPYLWTLGVFTFSSGLFYGGIHGEPRRTNMGLSYLDPSSPTFRPDWVTSTHIGALGGCIMTLAVIFYFYALITSLRTPSSAEAADQFSLPESEPYHDEDIGAVKNLKPWIIAAIVAVVVSYTPPLMQVIRDGYEPAAAYDPGNPVPLKK